MKEKINFITISHVMLDRFQPFTNQTTSNNTLSHRVFTHGKVSKPCLEHALKTQYLGNHTQIVNTIDPANEISRNYEY
jgi:hypothetical protein